MGEIEVFFFPMMAHGHMIPILDMAKLFASHGVKSTIITTPLNVPVFSKTIERTKHLGFQMSLHVIKFPTVPGLPEGIESADQVTSREMFPTFLKSVMMLQDQLEQLLREYRPNCLVADMFFPWATDVAAKFNIPRLVFHGTGLFSLCASEEIRLNAPFKNLSDDSEHVAIPNLPHEIKLSRSQVPPHVRGDVENDLTRLLIKVKESELRSYGVIVNSFYKLEPDYADHFRNVLGRKAWIVGPVSLCNRDVEEKTERGKKSAIDEHECLKWLGSKKPNSVIYLCFGSMCNFSSSQLYELAVGLEASGQDFIWVVRKGQNGEEDWLPEGFEERIKGKGLIIKGWAPQVVILDHQAIGGFVTHCGWNSILEGISAGVPMVTWPAFAEQFYNEKLVTEILGTGVAVGSQEWVELGSDGVKREAIESAVRRAKELKQMAKKAVEEGGSSHSDLSALIKDLSSYRS